MNVNANHVGPSDSAYVVGVDFGTLSGRAVIVRVADGAELGSAVHEYADGAIEAALPGTGRTLPPQWALQNPDDWREVLRRAVPAALANSGVDPRDVIGIAIDTTACTILPTTAAGVPLCELADLAGAPPCLAQTVEASRGAGAGRPHQRAGPRAGRGVDRSLRRPDIGRVGVRQGTPGAGGGPRDLPALPAMDRGDRLDRLGS